MNRIKNVKKSDIVAIPKFLLSIFPAVIISIYFRLTNRNIWLFSESNEAADNGYVLYKYIKEKYPEQEVYYAINEKSKDFQRFMAECGNHDYIEHGSLKHWIFYFVAQANISSQKDGKPNAAICYVLEVYGLLKNTRVFLQHGITLNNPEFLHYKNTKMRLFISGARPEYEYLKKVFGYPDGYIKYTGFARFDNLHNLRPQANKILLMPTWRSWLKLKGRASEIGNDDINDIANSNYVRTYSNLIRNEKLIQFLESKNLELYFYPHRNAQQFIKYFEVLSPNIKICSETDYTIDELLKTSTLMITDYSSVCMDFAYMQKPIIFFQFDEEEFRAGQYKESYFSYKNSGFGNYTQTIDGVVENLEYFYNRDFQVTHETLHAHAHFFKLYDLNNCERNYQAIKEIFSLEEINGKN